MNNQPLKVMHPLPETPEAIAKGCTCSIARDPNGVEVRKPVGTLSYAIGKGCPVHDAGP